MSPQPPLLLVDNLFDTVQQYPAAVLTASAERAGHEAYRIADYRRERSTWQPAAAAAGHYAAIDLGAGKSAAVDYVYLDRGHNLWGDTLIIGYSDSGVAPFTIFRTLNVPAIGTLGGDPTSTTMAVTEEGACWAIFTASGAHRAWQAKVPENVLPVVSGLMLGQRHQLLQFSSTFDEDAGDRTETSTTSVAGYKGTDTTYSWRTCDLALSYIGGTQYDASIRALRELLFKRNQPLIILLDYGTRPERGWMYQLDGKSWSMAKKRVYREGRLRFREVGASLS